MTDVVKVLVPVGKATAAPSMDGVENPKDTAI